MRRAQIDASRFQFGGQAVKTGQKDRNQDIFIRAVRLKLVARKTVIAQSPCVDDLLPQQLLLLAAGVVAGDAAIGESDRIKPDIKEC